MICVTKRYSQTIRRSLDLGTRRSNRGDATWGRGGQLVATSSDGEARSIRCHRRASPLLLREPDSPGETWEIDST
jgi:hypothetical protein